MPAIVDPFAADVVAAMPSLRAFGRGLTGRATEADDLVQQTVMKALQHRNRFTPGTNLGAWLFTILRNEFLSELRAAGRFVLGIDDTVALMTPDLRAPNPLINLELADVTAAVNRLPPLLRQAVWDAAEGHDMQTIARLRGVPVGTAKSRVHRGRKAVLEKMA